MFVLLLLLPTHQHTAQLRCLQCIEGCALLLHKLVQPTERHAVLLLLLLLVLLLLLLLLRNVGHGSRTTGLEVCFGFVLLLLLAMVRVFDCGGGGARLCRCRLFLRRCCC